MFMAIHLLLLTDAGCTQAGFLSQMFTFVIFYMEKKGFCQKITKITVRIKRGAAHDDTVVTHDVQLEP